MHKTYCDFTVCQPQWNRLLCILGSNYFMPCMLVLSIRSTVLTCHDLTLPAHVLYTAHNITRTSLLSTSTTNRNITCGAQKSWESDFSNIFQICILTKAILVKNKTYSKLHFQKIVPKKYYLLATYDSKLLY